MKPTKVFAYITRQTTYGTALLVFDHRDMPEVGTQVVAGTVEEHEDLETAILREVHEESGLANIKVKRLLLTIDHFHTEKQQHQIRNYFHLILTHNTPNSWSHRVSAGDEDEGMTFDFFWLSLAEAQEQLADKQDQAVGELDHTSR